LAIPGTQILELLLVRMMKEQTVGFGLDKTMADLIGQTISTLTSDIFL
jgi:hypothetical protein